MSVGRRDWVLFWLYFFLFAACVAGVFGTFFDAARPYALVTIGSAVTVFMVVAGVHSWGSVAREQRTRANLVVVVSAATIVELLIVGGLSMLHAPWRTAGIWLLAADAVLFVLAVLCLFRWYSGRDPEEPAIDPGPTTERPATDPGPTAEQPVTVQAVVAPATDQPAAGRDRAPDKDAVLDQKIGAVALAFAVVAAVCVCVPPWRTGATIVLVAGASLLYWAACGWLAVKCWRQRSPESRGRAVAGVVAAFLASVAAVAAAVLPVVAAGAFNLPPMRQVVAHAGPPPGGWWSGLVVGVVGFVVLFTIMATVAAPPVTVAMPSTSADAPVVTGPAVAELSFSPLAERAVQVAVAELPSGQHLTTGRVLAALVQVDVQVGWDRIWLHTGGFDPVQLVSAPDLPNDAGDPRTWRGVPVSGRLAASMRLAQRVGESYRLLDGSTGVLALALVAHRGNGATEALLAGGGLSHAELLWRVQIDVLDTTLEHLSAVIPDADD